MTDKAAYSINFGTAPLFIFPYNMVTTWEIKTGVRVLGERDIIIKSIEYMEQHLTEPLSLEGIAMQAGYSACHFARMFKAQMGVSVMEYVKQKRLIRAAREIRDGRRILDVALDYGYETHSGFTRAFTRQFGYSPALLRAFHVRDACLRGEVDMGLNMKETDVHMTQGELYQELCQELYENGIEFKKQLLDRVYELAQRLYQGKKRRSGDDYVTHPLNTAILLAQMGADEDTVCAGLLYDAEPDKELAAEIRQTVSKDTCQILEEVRQFKQYCSEDDRAVLVVLADRLHNMRTLEFMDRQMWKDKAEETLKIFSPIAAEFQKLPLKAELDELALRYL